jgi:hypothetical protein
MGSDKDSCVVRMLDNGERVTVPKKAVVPVQDVKRKDKVTAIHGMYKGSTAVVLGIDDVHVIIRLASQDIAVWRMEDVVRVASD